MNEQPPGSLSPQTTPTPNTPVNQSQVYPSAQSNNIVVGSQLPPEKKNYKKLIFKTGAGLIVVIVLLAILVLTNIIPLSRMKRITYDNGKGAKFSLKFYSKYTLKNVSQSTGATGVSPGLQELVSKVSIDNKYPVVMWLESNSSNADSFTQNDCSKIGMTRAFSVNIDSINSDVAVCSIESSQKTLIYIATFNANNKGYLAYISQDTDFSKLLSSPSSAQRGLEKVGLDTYQDDIQTILASIKPL